MDDHTPPSPLRDDVGAREVVGAWLVVALLLIGTVVSFTLDQIVTVADRADWSEISPASGENGDEDEPPEREIRDLDRR
jgi:hypothetical protein